MMTCGRAIAILRGLENNQLVVQANEIDELIKAGAVVEADPEHVHALTRIQQLHAMVPTLDDALSTFSLNMALGEIEAKLKDEWYRIRTGKEELRAQEQARVAIRYAIGRLSDRVEGAKLLMLNKQRTLIPDGAMYVACPSLGCELYAITHRGRSMRHELEIRLARFEPVAFPVFLKVFDKTYAKMDKFVKDLAVFSQGVPEVRKHRGQILVGLVKSGLSAHDATGTYREVLRERRPPDVAVTCARNLAKFGKIKPAMGALDRARHALQRAGFPDDQRLNGLAKSLLAYDPPDAGVPRFLELAHALGPLFPQNDDVPKYAARLMAADGTVPVVVRRVSIVAHGIAAHPDRAAVDIGKASAALASMVTTEDVLPGLVQRFFHVRTLLRHEAGNEPALATDYALECVACPGTPEEVVSLVRSFARRIGEHQPPIADARDSIAMAVAFAKRFAY